jgi:putative two-component system response regulator
LNLPETSLPTDTDSVHAAMVVAVFAMATLAETRDSDTGMHILRIQHYVMTLALRIKEHPRFAAALLDPYIRNLFQSMPLYDMGTIGIPDRILLKPGRLTPAEFEIMKTHTTLARDAIALAIHAVGCQPEAVQIVKEVALSHHEKWNGSGYPEGLSGEQIPLAARLIAIADVYDALISHRVYRVGMPHDQAVAIIFQGRGSHFDPDMVDAFMETKDEVRAIAQRYPDTDLDMQKKIEHMANAIAEEVELPES